MEHTFNNFRWPELIFFLKSLDPLVLPGLKAHLELTPYRATPEGKLETPANARKGGVAVIISLYGPQAQVVLTKRMDYKGVHGGQISFPGGKQEESDEGLLETALRETEEEIGFSLQRDELVTSLSGIYIPPSNFYVQPYLFITQREMRMTINHEVDYPILADIHPLLGHQSLQKSNIRLSDGLVIMDAPCFVYGKEIIWGATAAILNELKWLLQDYAKNLQEQQS